MEKFNKRIGLQKKVSSLFNNVPIPQDDDGSQPSEAHAPNETSCNLPNQMPTDRPISKVSLIKKFIKKLNRTEDSLDEAAPDESANAFPKPMPADHEMPQNPPINELNQGEDSLDEATPEESANAFPKPTPADHEMPQNPPINELNQSEDSLDETAPGESTKAFPKPMSINHLMPKNSLIKKLSQSEDSSDGVEQNQTANVFPNPTSTTKTPQNSLVNKRPEADESLKQPTPAIQPENEPVFEFVSVGFWQQIKDKLFTPKPGVSPIKQKAMVIMVPILAVVMIFVLRQVLSKSPRKTEGAGKDDTPVVVANADTDHEIDWEIPEPITIITRDPIKLPDDSDTQNTEQVEQNNTTGEITAGTMIVRDIVYSEDKPSALVGSKIVYVGDVINDITVVKIDRDSVEFEKNGDRWEQKVRKGRK
ncbi:MAG: hypothetical protein AMJ75_05865 [Phycisphaerae bacterium SM1_79]|nr:MAG: hypothetical protein AMJ75_05865 [Phycisphaerae bacterium SM1_79]